jgi:hypothetical protein
MRRLANAEATRRDEPAELKRRPRRPSMCWDFVLVKPTAAKGNNGLLSSTTLAVMGGKTYERSYDAPIGQVWDAFMDTIRSLRYLDIKASHSAGTIEYRTGGSTWTWRGQQMTAHIRDDAGSTVVTLEGRTPWQAYDWGENKRLAKKVLNRVGQRLLK